MVHIFIRPLTFLLFTVCMITGVFAQQHTSEGLNGTPVFKDSIRLALEQQNKRAWKKSLMLPGLGQYANGRLWWLKVPVIYGGFVTSILMFDTNNKRYRSYLKEAQYRVSNHDAYPLGSDYPYGGTQTTETFIRGKDYYRRNRDLTVLVTAGWYALNAIEAYVDSMLKTRWTIDDDLSVSVAPTAQPVFNQQALGLKIAVTLK